MADLIVAPTAMPSAKDLRTLVRKVLSSYTTIGKRLHEAACLVFVHTAEHGNPDILNEMFQGLRTNDRDAFRFWCQRKASHPVVDDDGNQMFKDNRPIMLTWLSFRDGKFNVNKGSENQRKGMYDPSAMVVATVTDKNGNEVIDSFLNVNTVAETKAALTAEKLVETLLKAAKAVIAKADKVEEGPRLDAGFLGKVSLLEAQLTEYVGGLKRVAVETHVHA